MVSIEVFRIFTGSSERAMRTWRPLTLLIAALLITGRSLVVNVYEHGYNLFKCHKLVFGSEKVWHWDNLIPLFTFQRQAQMDRLSRDSDLIQLNHPAKTDATTKKGMERLSGYDIIALANDDLHHPDRSNCSSVRCNFLDTPSARYPDLLATLRSGGYYCMRVPDYGHGDSSSKVYCHRGRHIVIFRENEGMAHCDGDWFNAGKVLDISILPSALKVLVPNG